MEESMEFKVPLYSKRTKCIGCGCSVGTKAKSHTKKANSVGMEKSLEFWISQQLVVHYNDYKMCSNCWNSEEISIQFKLSSDISEFKTLLDLLTSNLKTKRKMDNKIKGMDKEKKPLLNIAELSEEECMECCGISMSNLKQLSEECGCSIQIIFEFFCKCRQKISDRFGGVLFQKDQSAISHNFGRVLDKLTEVFVPKWLGSSAFTREEIIQYNTPYLFQQLMPNVRGGIDGTYFYVEKSGDFNYQRKTYSSHKGQNLVKEMGIILPNGKIFDFIGPFFSDGDHNDEWMWNYISDFNCGDINDVFDLEQDEFLADRGFIRVKDTEGMFALKTPVGLNPHQKQLSVEDANNSRLVTRFRNIVERVFGRLKIRWKIIGDVISSGFWPKLHRLLCLLAAIENAFSPLLWNDKESDDDDIQMIEERLNMESNELMEVFEQKDKGCWQKTTYEDVKAELPSLSLEDIRKWSVGPYALTLAKPYLTHCNELKFWKHKKLESVYKIKGMISRFVTSDSAHSKKYCILIKIPKDGNVNNILSYCTCKAGARTLGGCAHSCAILYHLTITDDSDHENKPNTSQKRLSTSGIIDLKTYRAKKKKENQSFDEESIENNDDIE